nr:tape measure protein [Candidatus Cloacimonadota bacterium]
MANVGSLDAQLRLDISNFASGIKEAIALTHSLRSSLNEAMGAGSGFYNLAGDMENIGEDIKTLASLVQDFNAEVNQAGKLDGFVQVQQHTAGLTENLRQSAFALDNIRKQLINIEPRMGRVAQLSKQITPGSVGELEMENLVQSGLGDLLLMGPGEELMTVSEKVKQVGADAAAVATEVKETATQTSAASDKVDDWTQNANMAKEAAKGWASSTREVAEESRRAAAEAAKSAKPQQSGTGFAWPTLKDSRVWKGLEKSARKYERDLFKAAAHQEKNRLASKDIKRIIGGIVISQVFYKLLDVMNQLVKSSIEFANNMDQAEIAFKYLLKDGDKANAMVRQLQDFSIASPLQTDDVMNATRQLMAMGFEAKEIIPTLSVMADTAAIFTSSAGGMAEMISGITLAIGQMRSSGKVMTQEMRQLYNAGVPVFEIMREELNLTAEEVRNIGKMNIDSELGVNALLRGLQKRYAGAAEEFTKTIPGALEVIQKNFRLIFTELSEEPRAGLSEWLNKVANRFKAFTAITRAYGPGGLMQALFPPHLHEPIRRLIGAFQQLGSALAIVGKILRDIFGGALSYIIRVMGAILPYISAFVHGLAQALQWIYTVVPWVRQLAQAFVALLIVVAVVRALKGLYNLLRIGKIIKWFIGGVGKLVKAFAAWVTGANVATAANARLVASLLLVIAVLALIASRSSKTRSALNRLWDSFKNIGVGVDTADILQPDFKKQVDV